MESNERELWRQDDGRMMEVWKAHWPTTGNNNTKKVSSPRPADGRLMPISPRV
jgi:hypothetical protein